jgi:hypothetical protein
MKAVIELWPSAEAMAADIGEKGVTVRAWKQRENIPADRDLKLIEAAGRRGIGLTLEHLARLRAGQTDVVIPVADCNAAARVIS